MKLIRKLTTVFTPAAWYVLLAITLITLALAMPACKNKEQYSRSDGLASFKGDTRIGGYESAVMSKPEAEGKLAARAKRRVITTHDMTIEVKNLATAFQTAIDFILVGSVLPWSVLLGISVFLCFKSARKRRGAAKITG